MKEEFRINVDGEEKVAKLVTRLYCDEIGLEYIYYYIKEENDDDNIEKELLTARIETDKDGVDDIIPVTTQVEKNLAFKIYADTYKKVKK